MNALILLVIAFTSHACFALLVDAEEFKNPTDPIDIPKYNQLCQVYAVKKPSMQNCNSILKEMSSKLWELDSYPENWMPRQTILANKQLEAIELAAYWIDLKSGREKKCVEVATSKSKKFEPTLRCTGGSGQDVTQFYQIKLSDVKRLQDQHRDEIKNRNVAPSTVTPEGSAQSTK